MCARGGRSGSAAPGFLLVDRVLVAVRARGLIGRFIYY
jgi:hypothetical protein